MTNKFECFWFTPYPPLKKDAFGKTARICRFELSTLWNRKCRSRHLGAHFKSSRGFRDQRYEDISYIFFTKGCWRYTSIFSKFVKETEQCSHSTCTLYTVHVQCTLYTYIVNCTVEQNGQHYVWLWVYKALYTNTVHTWGWKIHTALVIVHVLYILHCTL